MLTALFGAVVLLVASQLTIFREVDVDKVKETKVWAKEYADNVDFMNEYKSTMADGSLTVFEYTYPQF